MTAVKVQDKEASAMCFVPFKSNVLYTETCTYQSFIEALLISWKFIFLRELVFFKNLKERKSGRLNKEWRGFLILEFSVFQIFVLAKYHTISSGPSVCG